MQLSTVSSIIGIVGGILGLYSFIDNYALRFRPSIKLANQLYLTFEKDERLAPSGKLFLTSIICKLDIFNRRNKLGRLDDFSIEIYNKRSLNPRVKSIFPFYELDKLPVKYTDTLSSVKSPFTPKSILNKSNKELILEFCSDKLSRVILNPKDQLCIILQYKSKSGRWIKIGSYTLKTTTTKPEELNNTLIYSLGYWELDESRRDITDKKKRVVTSMYKGVSEYYFSWWLKKPYYILKKISIGIYDIPCLWFGLICGTASQLYSKIFIFNLLKSKGKKTLKPSFRLVNKKYGEITDRALINIRDTLQNKIDILNEQAEEDAQLTMILGEHGKLIIKRNFGQIVIYKSGDGVICMQDYKENIFGDMLFDLKIRKFTFGVKLWVVNDNKVLFLDTACIKLLDYFILHSDHR